MSSFSGIGQAVFELHFSASLSGADDIAARTVLCVSLLGISVSFSEDDAGSKDPAMKLEGSLRRNGRGAKSASSQPRTPLADACNALQLPW
jgi:hypothetical protein